MVGSVLCPVSVVELLHTAPLCWTCSIDQDYVTDPRVSPYTVLHNVFTMHYNYQQTLTLVLNNAEPSNLHTL